MKCFMPIKLKMLTTYKHNKPTAQCLKKYFSMTILMFVFDSVGHEKSFMTSCWAVEMLDNLLDHTYGHDPCMVITQNKVSAVAQWLSA